MGNSWGIPKVWCTSHQLGRPSGRFKAPSGTCRRVRPRQARALQVGLPLAVQANQSTSLWTRPWSLSSQGGKLLVSPNCPSFPVYSKELPSKIWRLGISMNFPILYLGLKSVTLTFFLFDVYVWASKNINLTIKSPHRRRIATSWSPGTFPCKRSTIPSSSRGNSLVERTFLTRETDGKNDFFGIADVSVGFCFERELICTYLISRSFKKPESQPVSHQQTEQQPVATKAWSLQHWRSQWFGDQPTCPQRPGPPEHGTNSQPPSIEHVWGEESGPVQGHAASSAQGPRTERMF